MINHNGIHIRFLHAMEHDGLDLKDRACYLTENAGQVAKLASYIERFPAEATAHRADLSLALADVMIQAAMMCLDVGFDPADIFRLGLHHVSERFEEFEARGWQ